MNQRNIKISLGGIPLLPVLILLKVFGYINWSWFLVFFPLWAPFAFLLTCLVGMAVLLAIVAFLESR